MRSIFFLLALGAALGCESITSVAAGLESPSSGAAPAAEWRGHPISLDANSGPAIPVHALNPGAGYSSGSTIAFSTAAPASITRQPASQTANPGASVTFSVEASGSAPLTYQWSFNGAPIPGQTSSTLTLASVTAAEAGTYTVEVGDGVETATSAGAILSLNEPVVITLPPASQAVNPGASVTFTVAATGTTPLTYQWKLNGRTIVGANRDSLSLNNLSQPLAGVYTVEVGNVVGTVTSAGATLSLNTPVSITQHPMSQVANPGANVTFTVAATGTAPLTYQWSFNGQPIPGETSSILALASVTATQAGVYTVEVGNVVGTVVSAGASLSLNEPVVITQPPASQTVNPGASVTFTVTATGTAPLTYQWKLNGRTIVGANSDSLSLNNLSQPLAGVYAVEVGNVVGTVVSAGASLSLNEPVVITQQPASQAVNPGASVTFTVAATGTTPLTYQWSFNGAPIPGETSSSLTLASVAATHAGTYTVEVGNVVGVVTSAGATLSLNTPVSITQQPANQAANPGASVTFTVAATGTAPLTYQWSFNGVPIGGETASSLTLASVAATHAGVYTVEVGNVVGRVVSAGASLSLNEPVVITQQPESQTVNPGASVTFTVAATGTAPLTYQWKFNGETLVGATTASLTLNNLSEALAGVYTVEVGNVVGTSTSAGATLNLNTPVLITRQPASQAVLPGASVTFTVAATGTAPLTYQWKLNDTPLAGETSSTLALTNITAAHAGTYTVEVGNIVGKVASTGAILSLNESVIITQQPASQTANPGASVTFTVAVLGTAPLTYQWKFNGTLLAGETSSSLTLASVTATNTGTYSVEVGNVAGTVTSAGAILSLNEPVVITRQPLGQTVNPGASVTFTVAATGTAPLTYQWQMNGAPIPGANAASLTLNNVASASAGTYSVEVSNVLGTVASAGASLSLNEPVVITLHPAGQTANPGASVTFTVAATGTAPLTYQWKFNGGAIVGAITPSLSLNNLSEALAGVYTVEVGNVAGTVVSAAATLSLNKPVSITQQPASQAVNPGASVTFTVVASGTAPLTYQWKFNGTPLAGATASSLALTQVAATNTGTYTVEVSNLLGTAASAGASLSLNEPVVITQQPVSQTANPGDRVTFTVAATGTDPLAYQWKFNDLPLAGETASSLTLAHVAATNAGTYSAEVSNAAGTVSSDGAVLSLNTPVTITLQPVTQTAEAGASVIFTVAAVGTPPLACQWYKNGAAIPAATNSSLRLLNVHFSEVGNYTVTVSNMAGSATSQVAGLTVKTGLSFGINDQTPGGGIVMPEPFQSSFVANSTVTLTARPADGWTFLDWKDHTQGTNPVTTLQMTSDKIVRARFGTPITVRPTGSGTVSLQPAAPLYPYDASVRLVAQPQPGNYFAGWSGNGSGDANPLPLRVRDASPVIFGSFYTLPVGRVALTVIPNGYGDISVLPNASTFTTGQAVTNLALPEAGQEFLGWAGDATGTNNPLVVSLNQSKVIFANFTKRPQLGIQPLGLDGLLLSLAGEFTSAYQIQDSTNLVDWRSYTAITNTYGESQTLAPPPAGKRLYYRAAAINTNSPGGLTKVDPSTLRQKVLMGYQGWFAGPGDGSLFNSWMHWFRSQEPVAADATFDLWPDTSELEPDELIPTRMTYADGSPARLYSACNARTVKRHFKWMEDQGLDGVLLNRFSCVLSDARLFSFFNQVAANVQAGAEAHGRVFALMYDITGQPESSLVSTLTNDWNYLAGSLQLTNSPAYLHHNGKPVIAIWGLGFLGRPGTAAQALELIHHFQSLGLTVVGGVPTWWRQLTGDSKTEPAWAEVYRAFDVISPWAVGRYSDEAGADWFKNNLVAPDLAAVRDTGKDFLPVIFPGFSWKNLNGGTLNQIPRHGGRFLWRQAHNAITAGCDMVYVAMFDEVDEGTAMFKIAPLKSQLPAQGTFISLDIDGEVLPGDWYLRLAGEITKMLRGTAPLSATIPIVP